MAEFSPALLWAAGICGAIATIWGLIEKATKPIKDLKERVSTLEKAAAENKTKLVRDHESLKKQEEINVMILRSCSVLMKHCADNNHTGELASMAKAVDDLVYKRSGSL